MDVVASQMKGVLRAVRARCKDCTGGPQEKGWIGHIAGCTAWDTCALWPYRYGLTPRVALGKGLDVDPAADRPELEESHE